MQVAQKVTVPALGAGYPDYGVAVSNQPNITVAQQTIGVANTPDWQTQLGNQKQIVLAATNLNTYTLDDALDRYVASALYTVTTGKALYIWMLSALMTYITATSTYNWLVEIYDVTAGTRLYAYAGGGLGAQCAIQFTQPLKIPSGHQVQLNFYNYGTPGPSNPLVGINSGTPVSYGGAAQTEFSQFTARRSGGAGYFITWISASGNFNFAVFADNAGSPGTLLWTSGTVALTASSGNWYYQAISPMIGITANTLYWLAVSSSVNSVYYVTMAGNNSYKAVYTLPFTSNPSLAGYTVVATSYIMAYLVNDYTLTHDDNIADARIIGYEL